MCSYERSKFVSQALYNDANDQWRIENASLPTSRSPTNTTTCLQAPAPVPQCLGPPSGSFRPAFTNIEWHSDHLQTNVSTGCLGTKNPPSCRHCLCGLPDLLHGLPTHLCSHASTNSQHASSPLRSNLSQSGLSPLPSQTSTPAASESQE